MIHYMLYYFLKQESNIFLLQMSKALGIIHIRMGPLQISETSELI